MEKKIITENKISKYAPRIYIMNIKINKIKNIIGKGGSTIRSLTEKNGINIDILENGIIKIYSKDYKDAIKTYNKILNITTDAKIGYIYIGKVLRITDFGA